MNPETRAAVKYSIPFVARIVLACIAGTIALVAVGIPPALVAIGMTLLVAGILATYPPAGQ